jgi:hypothetical protein
LTINFPLLFLKASCKDLFSLDFGKLVEAITEEEVSWRKLWLIYARPLTILYLQRLCTFPRGDKAPLDRSITSSSP